MFKRAMHPGEILPFGGLVCGAGTHRRRGGLGGVWGDAAVGWVWCYAALSCHVPPLNRWVP